MKVSANNGNIILSDVKDFDLYQTFECGQCFRWDKSGENSYTGIVQGKVLTIEQLCDNSFILYDTSEDDFQKIWHPYFDFGRDYGAVKSTLSSDSVMKTAIASGEGIRILQQDLWETVVSFIISASNNIPRIKKIISALCESFGEEIVYRNKLYHLFPAPEKIVSLSIDDISVIKAGFRDKYILDAADFFVNRCKCSFCDLDNEAAKKQLLSIKGVGNKVADCVMLFGLHRYNSFPVDVWIKRIMEYCYFDGKQKISDISSFAEDKFGELGGFAQQYLFFYARENKIEGDKN